MSTFERLTTPDGSPALKTDLVLSLEDSQAIGEWGKECMEFGEQAAMARILKLLEFDHYSAFEHSHKHDPAWLTMGKLVTIIRLNARDGRTTLSKQDVIDIIMGTGVSK